MRKALFVLAALAAVLALAQPALAADFDGEMNAQQWQQFKAKATTPPAGAKLEPVPPAGYPGCHVCTGNPTCKSGYRQTGFTEMLNFVVVKAWGDDSPGPGGYTRLMSKTITQNGVCVHDHVKAAVCNPQ
ncbi:MAG: hypothetical protein V1797_00220 [Pseudomonadota bacterium]